jgi:hypothetical protein
MRTALVVLIVLVRFGPDIVYAASGSLAPSDSAKRTAALRWIVSPPAGVVIRQPTP